jgi:hypothetical protein
MCRPMSGYAAIVNDEVKLWVSEKTDSHSAIAEEFGLRDNGRRDLYAFEFFPDEAPPAPDVTTWTLRWDSEATASSREKPGKDDEARFRAPIEKLAAKYVFRSGSHKTTACRAWVFETARVEARDSARVVAWGSSSVEAWGSSSVEARDSSRVEAWGSSRVEARDSSRVVAWGSSTTNSYGPKPVKLGERAVWIDRTGDRPVVTIAE